MRSKGYSRLRCFDLNCRIFGRNFVQNKKTGFLPAALQTGKPSFAVKARSDSDLSLPARKPRHAYLSELIYRRRIMGRTVPTLFNSFSKQLSDGKSLDVRCAAKISRILAGFYARALHTQRPRTNVTTTQWNHSSSIALDQEKRLYAIEKVLQNAGCFVKLQGWILDLYPNQQG